MARSSNKNTSSNNKKSVFKKLISLVVVIVLVLFGEHFYTGNISESNGDKESWLSYIFEILEIENPFDNDNTLENNQSSEQPKENDTGTKDYDGSKLEIYFFDVGQADSILLITDGKAMLVDTGNAGDATEKNTVSKGNINLTYELKKLGVDVIDILVATHAHEDHMGSMYKIVNAFDIGEVYANGFTAEEVDKRYYDKFEETMNAKGIHLVAPTSLTEKQIKAKISEYNANVSSNEDKITYNAKDYIRVGDVIALGDAKLTLLAPASSEYSDENDYSLVFMVEFEGVKVLLTGDAGKESEEEILAFAKSTGFDLDCDVLKVSHHGSRTANTEEFIAAVKPEYSVIMVEEGNSYGLPDEDVVERLERHDSKIYYTMTDGDIKLTIDNGSYEFDFSYNHEEK